MTIGHHGRLVSYPLIYMSIDIFNNIIDNILRNMGLVVGTDANNSVMMVSIFTLIIQSGIYDVVSSICCVITAK